MTIFQGRRMPIISAFMVKLRLVLAELARPDAMRDNWFVWAAGQGTHMLIGVVLAGTLLFFLPPITAFLAAAVGYATLKELPDFLQDRSWANARDCVQDALFVTAGSAFAVAISGGHEYMFFAVLGAIVTGLALGIYERLGDE
jgi:hypothetical protein